MKKPNFTLIAGYVPFVFVIPPSSNTEESSQNSESVNILDKGEVVLDGDKNCRRVSFQGFFPSINSRFYSILNPLPPIACKEFLQYHKDNNTKLKLVIPEWTEFLKCKITDLSFSRKDHTGDIYYTISLVEEREEFSNLLDLATGLYKRVIN